MDEDSVGGLTPGEIECLRFVHSGSQIDDIAFRLGISVPGVKYRLKQARTKLGVGSSGEAARKLFGPSVPPYSSRIDPERIVVSDDQSLLPGSTRSTAGPVGSASELHEAQAVYLAGSQSQVAPDADPIRQQGGGANDLKWHVKLALGLGIGFAALAAVGAAVSLQNALRPVITQHR